ncbi:MAG: hypothetical protein RL515_1183, partial [Verrucomicrobiota bacterium]
MAKAKVRPMTESDSSVGKWTRPWETKRA